jgi:hypothetical protein
MPARCNARHRVTAHDGEVRLGLATKGKKMTRRPHGHGGGVPVNTGVVAPIVPRRFSSPA